MNYFYTYLILDENRLVITEKKIASNNYLLLMDNNGMNKSVLHNTCKMFCIGYILGSNSGRKIVNDPNEFT